MEITDYQFNGIPVFIYGLIGLTTAILTYATVASDSFSSPEEESAANTAAISSNENIQEQPEETSNLENPQQQVEEQEQPPIEEPPPEQQVQAGQGLTLPTNKKSRSHTYKSYYRGKHVSAHSKYSNKTKFYRKK